MDKRISFDEIDKHLMNDDKPSVFFNSLDEELETCPLNMLAKLKGVDQSPKYHPEGNVWNHTMLVVDEAAKIRKQCNNPKAVMWAALLHDIGKPDTTKVRKGRITSYNHDEVGAELTKKFLEYFSQDEKFIEEVSAIVKYHMHMLYIQKGLPFGNPTKMKRETDIHDLALLCRCDRLGRTGADVMEEEKNYNDFIEETNRL